MDSSKTNRQQTNLSFEQERMWLLDQIAPGNPANNIRSALMITGTLDASLLVQSINHLIERHEILRTHFAQLADSALGEPNQVINDPFPVTLPITDLRGLPADGRDAAAQRMATDFVMQPFDLATAPLWRAQLLRLAEDRHLFVLCIHHIICDGDWSLGIFFREMILLHEAYRADEQVNLPPLSMTYREFTQQQTEHFTDEVLAPHLAYWQQQLSGAQEVLQLPIDRPRPTMQSYHGSSQTMMLSPEQVAALRQLSLQADVPFFETLLATVKTLLYRYTQQTQIAVGSPTSGRLAHYGHDVDGLLGYFGNPVVLRTELNGDLTFMDLLACVHTVTTEAETHQPYPFQKLVQQLNLDRDLSTTPLFQVLLFMRNAAPRTWSQCMMSPQRIGGLTIEAHDVHSLAVPYELFLSLQETRNGLLWTWEYNTDLFDATTVQRMMAHCQTLLNAIITNPHQPIGHLPMLTQSERQQLLIDYNKTHSTYPQHPIHHLFESQVKKTPNEIAVLFDSPPHPHTPTPSHRHTLSYNQLNTRANQLSHHLQKQGIGPDTFVGICVERSSEMIVGLLGILKAGGAYVPLDADYPVERLTYMLADSGTKVLLTTETQLAAVPDFAKAAQQCQVICLDSAWPQIAQESTENPTSTATIDNLIYAIYTSGSTGQSKGAALPHRVLTNLVTWHQQHRLVGLGVRMLQVSPISFDLSAHEIFATLCTGGTLVLVSDAVRRNPLALLDHIRTHAVEKLYLPFIALQQLAEAAVIEGMPTALREMITAGEQLQMTPTLTTFFAQTGATLHNHYGGSEIQDVTALTLIGDAHTWPVLPSIGQPIHNVQSYILDPMGQPVPLGIAGELYIGGDALAQGYLNRPDLNKERFIANPFGKGRLYRTHDLARYIMDAADEIQIEHLGRIDNLVKIRGFRVELGEIETTLMQHEAVRECVVMPHDNPDNPKQLVAYVVAQLPVESHALLDHLRTHLPDYMIPAQLMQLDAMPLTPTGKVNRRALPAPTQVQAQPASREPESTGSDIETQLVDLWGDLLHLEHVGVDDTFFDMGGNSLLLIQAHKRLAEHFGVKLSPVTLFQYPSVRTLAQHLKTLMHTPEPETKVVESTPKQILPESSASTDIAIIGMACRFPDANNVDEFWQNLSAGVESISFFTDNEIELDDPDLLTQDNYIKAGSVLRDIDHFDAGFFGYSAREAEVTDPQQRLLLECAWEAFEQAGYNPEIYDGEVGVYTGSGLSTYLINNVAPHLGFSPHRPFLEADAFQAKMSNDRNYYPTRISYKLNLTGPSLNVQTACSTSLVSVHLACQALRNGDCDMALAGGSAVVVPHKVGYPHHEGMIHSPDGHTRTFDAAAQGTLFGNGAGMVVLKRLDQAWEDGDHVIAIVKGSAMNNDGAVKVGYTAPSVEGQATVIRKALATANVDASTIGYIEAHGTATALGDPIEVAALTQAFERSSQATLSPEQCAIGSVKTNIGHLDEAAGIASFIKTALTLHHGQIPPNLHFEQPNPQIDFANSPFYVSTSLYEWPRNVSESPRRAGVSSFGMGGTNCHVVMEERGRRGDGEMGRWGDGERTSHLFTFSAQSIEALSDLAQRYVDYLSGYPAVSLADICFTANVGRKHFDVRQAIVATSCADLQTQLEALVSNEMDAQPIDPQPSKVAFLFTGQGSQYVGMAQQLYQTHPTFRQTIDHCDELLTPHLSLPLLKVLFNSGDELHYHTITPSHPHTPTLSQTQYTQPALFAIEYALAQLWRSWRIEPDVVMGHSVGEYVAACLAGVFSLEDGLKLIAARGRLMQALPEDGAMMAVRADEADVAPLLALYADKVAVAAVNGPQATVLSGDKEAIATIDEALKAKGIKTTKLAVSHAFHSPLMEPMLDDFAKVAHAIDYTPPQRTVISNVTGREITSDIAIADYWVNHVRQPVRFADGVKTLHDMGISTLIEIGPKPTLLGMAGRIYEDLPPVSPSPHLPLMLPSLRPKQDDLRQLLQSLGELYQRGAAVDWVSFNQPYTHRRVPLPTYPFQRKRYWVEADKTAWVQDSAVKDDESMLYQVAWQPQPCYGLRPDYLSWTTLIHDQLTTWLTELSQTDAMHMYSESLAQLESLTVAYILTTFREMGWVLQIGERFTATQKAAELDVVDLHLPLFTRFLAILAEEGILRSEGAQWVVQSTPVILDVQSLVDSLAHLNAPAETTLLTRCGEGMVSALRGECDPVQLLFPGGDTSTMAQIYRDSPVLKATNTLVQEAVQTALAALPAGRGVRILEIGAGTGGTASHLLPHLSPTQTEYVYTDISAFFIAKAEENFAEYSFVRYEVLDIEQDPLAQGFDAHSFDLIVAADVLHATRDMHETMTHVRQLLAPDGLLVLMEDTAPLYWIDLTFGLTEGWWRFTDRGLRPDHPLLSADTWRTLLADTGFGDVQITSTGDIADAKLPHEAVIVACADDAAVTTKTAHWLILADQEQGVGMEIATHLREQDQQYTLAIRGKAFREHADGYTLNPANPDDFDRLLATLPAVDRVVHCWGMDTQPHDIANTTLDSCGSALHLVQSLLAHEERHLSPQLWLVTAGAQAVKGIGDVQQPLSSSLWGVGKIIALEHPELHCVCVDLDAEGPMETAQALVQEMLATDGQTDEDQLAFRGEHRYIARLTEGPLAQSNDAALAVADGTYLITGGLGGLGLLVADFLVNEGARQVVLLGRSAPSAEAQTKIDALEAKGATVTVTSCDASDRTQLAAVLAQIDATLPPLRGVVHAAGVLDDGTIRQQQWSRFETVMAPKAYGAWYLHELTQQHTLDFFVLFSSSSALLGTAGQANHVAANTFLDALASYRRGLGQHGLAINWGAWAEVGATARMGVLDHLLERGEGSIAPTKGIDYMAQLLHTQATHMAVMPVDWSLFLAKRLTTSTFFAQFMEAVNGQDNQSADQQAGQSTTQTMREQLDAASDDERPLLLTKHVTSVAIQVLGWHSTEPLDTSLGFFDLGMDSLTSIELRNRLNRSLSHRLPVTLAFDYPTVDGLVDYLVQDLYPAVNGASPNGSHAPAYQTQKGQAPEKAPEPVVEDVTALSDDEAEALLLQELEGFDF
ncbi:MAG: amino acid adenylation domain-containing protein [Chloroflexota bacterium]